MFIWLTKRDGRKVFVNNDNISAIIKEGDHTIVAYNTPREYEIVMETPEEIEVIMEEKARKVLSMHVAASTAAASKMADNEMAELVDLLRQSPTGHARPPYTEADGYADGSAVWEYYCPACNEYFDETRPNYCPKCGQKIDWSEAEHDD